MNTIPKFKDFCDDMEFLKFAIENGEGQELMAALYQYRFENIGSNLLEMIFNRLFTEANYKTPDTFFQTVSYKSFMDYFMRKLSDEKWKGIQENVLNYSMVLPCECDIESIGTVDEGTDKIIRLKEEADVINDLRSVGINTMGMDFINMKLRKCYYHRIHSPIDGNIVSVIPAHKSAPLFGNNTLWL